MNLVQKQRNSIKRICNWSLLPQKLVIKELEVFHRAQHVHCTRFIERGPTHFKILRRSGRVDT